MSQTINFGLPAPFDIQIMGLDPRKGIQYLVNVRVPEHAIDSLAALEVIPMEGSQPGQGDAQLLDNLARTAGSIFPDSRTLLIDEYTGSRHLCGISIRCSCRLSTNWISCFDDTARGAAAFAFPFTTVSTVSPLIDSDSDESHFGLHSPTLHAF